MEFLSEVWSWIGRHQPVWPFPFICSVLGSWWMGCAVRFLFSEYGSESESSWSSLMWGSAVWGGAAVIGLLTGQWYFLVPTAFGALFSLPIWMAIMPFIMRLKDDAPTTPAAEKTERPAVEKRKGPEDFIRTCEDIVRRYRASLPADSIEVIRAHELADAKLEALRKLFALHERLKTVAHDDEMGFDAIVKEANSIFPRVPLNKELVQYYESQRVDLEGTLDSIREAIESVYLSILHLPFEARDRIIAEVPQEYLRLQDPDNEDPPAEALPHIEIPQRVRESDSLRPAPFPKIAQ